METLIETTPFPKAPNDGARLWMRVAWLASGAWDQSSRSTGAVATRTTPGGPDRCLLVAGSDGGSTGEEGGHSATRNLVSQAARHGVCLSGSTCFLFPGLGCSGDFQLLLDCGISKVFVPGVPVPKRLKGDEHTCRWAASSCGVEIGSIELDAIFSPLGWLHD